MAKKIYSTVLALAFSILNYIFLVIGMILHRIGTVGHIVSYTHIFDQVSGIFLPWNRQCVLVLFTTRLTTFTFMPTKKQYHVNDINLYNFRSMIWTISWTGKTPAQWMEDLKQASINSFATNNSKNYIKSYKDCVTI